MPVHRQYTFLRDFPQYGFKAGQVASSIPPRVETELAQMRFEHANQVTAITGGAMMPEWRNDPDYNIAKRRGRR